MPVNVFGNLSQAPYLSGVTIYPLKSLDGLSLIKATVLPCGALANDRRWRLVDSEGRVVNAKRTARFDKVRAEFVLEADDVEKESLSSGGNHVTLWVDLDDGQQKCEPLGRETFSLIPGKGGPCEWLSEALGENVFLQEHVDGGFPDDRDAPGPTLVSTETLEELCSWFDWDEQEVRRRLRMNLEFTGGSANTDRGMSDARVCLQDSFWEDQLVSPQRSILLKSEKDGPFDPYADQPAPEPCSFVIGSILFQASGICRRCVVPSRGRGLTPTEFIDIFEARRRKMLRNDVDATHWPNFYRVGVNTVRRNHTTGEELQLGMPLHII